MYFFIKVQNLCKIFTICLLCYAVIIVKINS